MIKKKNKLIAAVLMMAVLLTNALVPLFGSEVKAEDKYPIMGPSNVTIGQLMNYYNSVTSYPADYASSDAPTLDAFCRIYLEECAAENVRVEVAFCQAMNETNYLRYTGRVPRWAYNFAGIGATDSTQDYNVFSSVREGVRAQVQHLKAYASTEPLNQGCVDPRFHYVSRGCAPYLEDLSGRWASSPTYGTDIRYNFMARLGTFNGFCTMYNGVEYSLTYDPEYYLEHHPDLAAAYANDGYALIAHYVNYGIDEGRQAKEYFSPDVYKSNYVDLRNEYGFNIGDYTRHYLLFGSAEGRQGWLPNGSTDKAWKYYGLDLSSVYNYNYYVVNNPDVNAICGGDDLAVIRHFATDGMNEGRRASENFDYNSYKNEYADLRSAFGYDKAKYYAHYVFYGNPEGRHGTGCNELKGRITALGGRDYSAVYNFDYYVNNNPDVYATYGNDDIMVLVHFIWSGMTEGRQASDEFNVWSYAGRYPDLYNAFWLDIPAYYYHYMDYGKSEGRIGA